MAVKPFFDHCAVQQEPLESRGSDDHQTFDVCAGIGIHAPVRMSGDCSKYRRAAFGQHSDQSIANGIQNPKIDANGFLVTPWVRNAMMSAFAMRAAHLGLHIDPNGVPVTIHITGVRTKSDAARMEFNFLDGAEWVSGTVSVGNASFTIQEDTWLYWPLTGYRSIEEVSEAVGKQVANGVALVAGMPIED
jgi:hypothetical protein